MFRRIYRFLSEFGNLYFNTRLTRASAAMAYFLTMTFFPLLICLYTMLGNSYTKAMQILDFASNLIAAETAKVIRDFFYYVALNHDTNMMIAALIVLITSASAAVRSVQATIGELQGSTRYRGLSGFIYSLLFSVLFLVMIYFAVLVMLTGSSFLAWVNGFLPFIDITSSWKFLRFVLLAAICYGILRGVYEISQDRGEHYNTRPGALVATLAMVGVSILFSVFISASVRYPLVYGSLASVILLMMWLYAICVVIYCGAAINVATRNIRRENEQTRFAAEPTEDE